MFRNRINLVILSLFLYSAVLLASAPTVSAQFNFFKGSCKDTKTNSSAESSVCKDNEETKSGTSNPITETINDVATIIASVAAVFAIFIILLGGFNLITSGGSTEAVALGRRRIVYSLIGLVIIALAWAMTRFITDRVLQ
ncbi:hypothetical protein H0X09_00055 [Candidatus Saccharibacteria bacterium]|nr:hypothetical protein [Candidatus Saccharibacteria bacterium]